MELILVCSFFSYDTTEMLRLRVKVSVFFMVVSLAASAFYVLLKCHTFFSLSQLSGILSSNALEDTVCLLAIGKCCCNEAGLH